MYLGLVNADLFCVMCVYVCMCVSMLPLEGTVPIWCARNILLLLLLLLLLLFIEHLHICHNMTSLLIPVAEKW